MSDITPWTTDVPRDIQEWTVGNWIDEARRQRARAEAAEAERDHQTRRGDEHFASAVTFKERWSDALGLGETWRTRAEAAEARILELEARLAEGV